MMVSMYGKNRSNVTILSVNASSNKFHIWNMYAYSIFTSNNVQFQANSHFSGIWYRILYEDIRQNACCNGSSNYTNISTNRHLNAMIKVIRLTLYTKHTHKSRCYSIPWLHRVCCVRCARCWLKEMAQDSNKRLLT